MALIRCPECGKKISDKSEACLYCGCPSECYQKNADRQEAAVEDGQAEENIFHIEMPTKPTIFNKSFIWACFWLLLDVFCLVLPLSHGESLTGGYVVMLVIIALISTIMFGIAVGDYREEQDDYGLAQVDFDKYREKKISHIKAEMVEVNARKLQAKQRRENTIREQKELAAKRRRCAQEGVACCPQCGSTNIVTMPRGYGALTGFVGSGDPINVCQACGRRFKPGK